MVLDPFQNFGEWLVTHLGVSQLGYALQTAVTIEAVGGDCGDELEQHRKLILWNEQFQSPSP